MRSRVVSLPPAADNVERYAILNGSACHVTVPRWRNKRAWYGPAAAAAAHRDMHSPIATAAAAAAAAAVVCILLWVGVCTRTRAPQGAAAVSPSDSSRASVRDGLATGVFAGGGPARVVAAGLTSREVGYVRALTESDKERLTTLILARAQVRPRVVGGCLWPAAAPLTQRSGDQRRVR